MVQEKHKWEVSEYYESDEYASKKSNLTEKRISGYYPNAEYHVGTDGIKVKLLLTNPLFLNAFNTKIAKIINNKLTNNLKFIKVGKKVS